MIKIKFTLDRLLRFLDSENIPYGIYFPHKENRDPTLIDILGFSAIDNSEIMTLSWSKAKINDFSTIKSFVIICPEDQSINVKNKIIILTKDPRSTFSRFSEMLMENICDFKIYETAKISQSARIGTNGHIGNHSIIGDNCKIGNNAYIGNNVVIYPNTIIGNNCHISCGAIIGSDGFGYYKDDFGIYHKITHMSTVVIGNKVEIGANTCIDRGVLDPTLIGDGCKIDNLCQIAHNVTVGPNTIITAGVILCGSSKIGSHCWLAPGCVVKNGVKVGSNVTIGMNSVVYRSIKQNNVVVVGDPAKILKKS